MPMIVLAGVATGVWAYQLNKAVNLCLAGNLKANHEVGGLIHEAHAVDAAAKVEKSKRPQDEAEREAAIQAEENRVRQITHDLEPGKDGGPTTEEVLQQTVAIDLSNKVTKIEIRRGTLLESLGGGKISVGATLYPIKLTVRLGGKTKISVFHFFKDSFGDWSSIQVES